MSSIILMILFLAVRTSKLISRKDPLVSMTTLANKDGIVRLWEYDFMFAIE